MSWCWKRRSCSPSSSQPPQGQINQNKKLANIGFHIKLPFLDFFCIYLMEKIKNMFTNFALKKYTILKRQNWRSPKQFTMVPEIRSVLLFKFAYFTFFFCIKYTYVNEQSVFEETNFSNCAPSSVANSILELEDFQKLLRIFLAFLWNWMILFNSTGLLPGYFSEAGWHCYQH